MFFLQKYEFLILDRTKLDNFDFEVIFAKRHGLFSAGQYL